MNSAPSITLPSLDIEAWENTKMTLHLYLQIVGKIQLALMPRRNHWWNITFLPNSKGLVTHTMPFSYGDFEIQFNFLTHQVEISVCNGVQEIIALRDGLSVPEFYNRVCSILDHIGIRAKITPHPYSLPDENPIATAFTGLTEYHYYDAAYVKRFWDILNWTAVVFREFSGQFYGKTSPVQLFWHHMDLAVTRFCGRRAPQLPAGSNIANKDAYSHELISFGFWAGDNKVRFPAFYSYTYPSPAGIDNIPFSRQGRWVQSNGSPMALLSYDDLRREEDPHGSLLSFLEQCYQAGAKLCDWDIAGLEVPPINTM